MGRECYTRDRERLVLISVHGEVSVVRVRENDRTHLPRANVVPQWADSRTECQRVSIILQ